MSTEDKGIVAFLSGDLIFASKIKGAAQAAGFDFYFGGNLPAEGTESIRYVVLDLATRSGLTDKLVGQCNEACPDAELIAFGPHVDVTAMNAAKEAGIPTVLTRGQFDANMSSLFG